MKQQIPHKIGLIALILVVFALPFSVVHFSTPNLDFNDYALSATAVNGHVQTDNVAPDSIPLNDQASGLSVKAGSTF